MRPLITAIVASVLFFGAVSARAQEENPPTRDMPTGTVLTVQNVQYKAFTLDEYKTLALIYADYLYFINQNVSLHKELTLRLDMEKNYELQVQGFKDLTKTLELDRDYWNTRVKEEQEANKRREVMSGLERFGAWALVAVEAVALGALGIAQVAQ
jgi:hypothetical protein